MKEPKLPPQDIQDLLNNLTPGAARAELGTLVIDLIATVIQLERRVAELEGGG